MEFIMSKQRKIYTDEFKKDAVNYWNSCDLSRDEVADKLGISCGSMLTRWARDMRLKGADAFPGNGKLSGKDAEIAKLKKQLKNTEDERDILKKAMAIFSKY